MKGRARARSLEQQRRRLYRAGATAEDVRRYRVAARLGREPRPARPRRLGPAWFGAAALVALTVLLLLPRTPAAPRTASPAAAPSPAVAPSAAAGGADITWAEAGIALTWRGRGDRTVPIAADLAPRAVSMTVALAPARRAPVGWRLLRSGADGGGTTEQLLAERFEPLPASGGDPVMLEFDQAPTAVAVRAPDGVPWTLVVTLLAPATVR